MTPHLADRPEPHSVPGRAADLTRAMDAVVAAHRPDDPPLTISYQVATGDRVLAEHDPDRSHYAASTMKLPLLLAAYRSRDAGLLDLRTAVEVHNSFGSAVGDSYGLDREDDSDEQVWDRLGQSVELGWLCRRSIVRSSNLATNLVLAEVGIAAVEDAIAACDAVGVQVVRGIGDFAAQRAGGSNLVTAAGLNRILLALEAGTAAAPHTCAEVLDVLAANEVATDIRPGLPEGTWVAHKNGWVSDVVLDAALVHPAGRNDPAGGFALTAAVSGDWPNERSHALIRDLARTAWSALTGG